MSKVTCDICGTVYSEFEDFCPNCGCSQDVSADMDMELEEDDFLENSPFTAAKKQKEAAAAEEQEKQAADEVYVDTEPEEEDEEPRTRGVGLAIVLTMVIMLLLSASAFMFLRFVLPDMGLGKLPEIPETVTQEQKEETGEGIPCRMLVLTSGATMELTREGEYKLIHVMVKPEDTTDILTYVSSDESIVTVTEDGRLTAIAEGEAAITITCGDQSLVCRIYVAFTDEPVLPMEEPELPVQEEEIPEEPEMEAPEESQPAETEEPVPETTAAQLKNVTLKLGKSEFILPPGYTYTVPLDCDLGYEEIEWSIENPGVASVKNGVVSGLTYGVTTLTAKYGDQTVTCVVRIKSI